MYIIEIFRHFDTKIYTWRLDLVQNLCEFGQFFRYTFLGKNVLISPDHNLSTSLDQNMSILLVRNMQWEYIVILAQKTMYKDLI